jgi:hypothetical protein
MADRAGAPLVCPRCASAHSLDERFCVRCGMPLVYAGRLDVDRPATETRARARKIKPQYTQGELVPVARANHQAEAELIQGILLEEGVPSTVRRSAGFDVPDMLAAGPRDVMVPASGAQAAREVLLQAQVISEAPAGRPVVQPWRLLAGLLLAVALVAVVLWIGTDLIR